MDIGTGAGLAGASGVRPFLPPLLAGALARGDVGIDFDGTDWSFLESPAFLGAVLVVGLVAYGAERSRAAGAETARSPLDLALLALAATLGALLFAGALADGGHGVVIGLVAGPACAVLGGLAVGGLAQRARRRLDPAAAARGCARARRHRHRLRRDRLELPRVAGLPVRRAGAGRDRLPGRTFGGEPSRG